MSEIIAKEQYIKDLVKLTYDIKLRPGLYIGKNSIVRLHQFLNGFTKAYHYLDAEKNVLSFIQDFKNGFMISMKQRVLLLGLV